MRCCQLGDRRAFLRDPCCSDLKTLPQVGHSTVTWWKAVPTIPHSSRVPRHPHSDSVDGILLCDVQVKQFPRTFPVTNAAEDEQRVDVIGSQRFKQLYVTYEQMVQDDCDQSRDKNRTPYGAEPRPCTGSISILIPSFFEANLALLSR